MPPLFFVVWNIVAGMTSRTTKLLIAVLSVVAVAASYLTYRIYFAASGQPVAMASKKIYICPMHPEIVQEHPGTCPICGMKLVEGKEGQAHEHGIQADHVTLQRLGVRLVSVTRASLGQELRTYGNVLADERKLYQIYPRYDGWVRKLHVHAVGERVQEGQVIYEIYSPDLINRERLYIGNVEKRKQLLKTIPTTADTENEYVMELAMDEAKDRSRLHVEEGLSTETIQTLEEKREVADIAQIVAARSGVVTQLNVREGGFASAAAPIMTLSDVARVWIDLPLYPDQAAMVQAGDPVSVRAPDGQLIQGKLDFISPLAENNKIHARVYLDNTPYHLKPGSYADVTIMAHAHPARMLPRSAIIYTAQGNRVMLSRGEGSFLPVPVETGAESGDYVEIVSGLREGAEVAVNGQFLLDASASMQAASERMHAH